MNFRLLLLVLAFLFGLRADAGIRVVLGGGGYAEMLTLSIFNKMPRLLLPYLQEPLKSTLTPDEILLIGVALSPAHRQNMSHVEIEFEDHMLQDIHYVNDFRVRLARSALYHTDGKAKDFGAIAALVFKTWVGTTAFEPIVEVFKPETVLRFARRLEKNSSNQFNVQSLPLKMPAVIVHAVSVPAQLLIEFPTKTVNITQQIIKAANCSENSELLKLGNLRNHIQGHIKGEVLWRCGNGFFKGFLSLTIPEDLQPENVAAQLAPAFYSVQPTEFDDCERLLQ